jgi:hypothetical protein
LSQQISITAVDHHTFGSDKDLGEGQFVIDDHRAGEFWVELGNGARVKLRTLYQEKDKNPATPDKKINSPFRRSKQ